LRDAFYEPAQAIAPHPHPWASLSLALEGGYVEDWGRTRVRCGPGSLVFRPPDEVYGDRISDAGSRCFTVAIDPAIFQAAADAVPALTRLHAPRSGPPRWLAFQLRAELELGDDLSQASVESAVFALLAELGDRPALEAGGEPPGWLERVRERIHDEFARTLTLAALAETAGVHRVHLARAFRRHYACTVGDYMRQRRVEYASHRLIASGDRLSQIAFDAGFADQSHFTNTFRRLVGLTPAAFRGRFRPHRTLVPH
jgi:AraC family transcriptional regulator